MSNAKFNVNIFQVTNTFKMYCFKRFTTYYTISTKQNERG